MVPVCRSVLVLGDRTPIGRVEEVFGPVATPFYALRYAGAAGSAIPASIAPGSPMFSVLKFSTFISPDELVGRGGGRDTGDGAVGAHFLVRVGMDVCRSTDE